jgi:Na+-translocating ferredoxin:NAD+ oxidoreductase RnfD subunit
LSHIRSETDALRAQSRAFTEFAFGLMSLAALAFAAVVQYGAIPVVLSEEARAAISVSFVSLATLDAALLLIWQRAVRWIATVD